MNWSRIQTFFEILRDYDAPATTKLREAVSNNLKKIRTGQPCCGHPGHPGC